MDFFLDPSGDFFETPKPERVRQSAADRQKQKELALERKRLEANRSFDEWWQLKPVRTPSEVLSTLAKVQIVRFLNDWDNIATSSFRKRMALRCVAPLHIRSQGAGEDYLFNPDSSRSIRDIICNFWSSSVTDSDVLPTDVCSEIYGALFPCPRCSASDTLRQVFHHKGANGRELRYELSFSSWDDRHVTRDGITLRTLHDIRNESFAPIKAVLSKVNIAARISDCTEANDPTAGHRPLVSLFTVYARDVFAYLDRYDLDRSELVSFTWRQILLKTRASVALRSLCMELILALDGTWIIPILYNPGLDNYYVDRRQFKLPYQSVDLDSQLMQGHLRNSFVASIVAAQEWGEDMPDASNEAIRWVCEMIGGLDNCHIGELEVSRVHPHFEDMAAIFDRAMSRNRPQKLSMSFDSDEQFRQFVTLDGFLIGGALRDIELMQFCVTASFGPVMPAWRLLLFLTPCIRKLGIHYEICESADASGLRHVVDGIIEDFLSLEQMSPTDIFDFYLSARRLVPFLRENHVSTSSNVHVTDDASWCRIGDFACDEFCFHNANCQKELIVYTSVTEYESVVLCRLR